MAGCGTQNKGGGALGEGQPGHCYQLDGGWGFPVQEPWTFSETPGHHFPSNTSPHGCQIPIPKGLFPLLLRGLPWFPGTHRAIRPNPLFCSSWNPAPFQGAFKYLLLQEAFPDMFASSLGSQLLVFPLLSSCTSCLSPTVYSSLVLSHSEQKALAAVSGSAPAWDETKHTFLPLPGIKSDVFRILA